MHMQVKELIEKARQTMQPIFALSKIEHYTGGALKVKTVRNLRCARQIPSQVFLRQGKSVLIDRDQFLIWWAQRLSEESPNRSNAAQRVSHDS